MKVYLKKKQIESENESLELTVGGQWRSWSFKSKPLFPFSYYFLGNFFCAALFLAVSKKEFYLMKQFSKHGK